MTRPTIAALIGTAPMALSLPHAAHHLMQELPQAAAEGGPRASAPERFVIARGVAVVPVRGLLTANNAMLERWLGWTTFFGLAETLAELTGQGDVSAIVLEVDSPGGFVTGLETGAEAIRMAARAKPVHALVNPLAASGGYWLAAQAHDISLTPGAAVGSIGVVVGAASSVGPDSQGDQWHTITSTHARAKRPDPGTEAGRAELQRSLDEAEAEFHAAVALGRRIPPEDLTARLSVTQDLRDGGAMFGTQAAVARGLADRIETRHAFYDRVLAQYAPQPRKPSARAYAARAAAAAALAVL